MLGFDAWISFCLPWRNSFLRLQLLLFLWNLASWGLLDRFFFLEYGFAASFPRFRSSLEWRIVLTMTWTVAFDRVRDTCGMDFLIIVFWPHEGYLRNGFLDYCVWSLEGYLRNGFIQCAMLSGIQEFCSHVGRCTALIHIVSDTGVVNELLLWVCDLIVSQELGVDKFLKYMAFSECSHTNRNIWVVRTCQNDAP